MEEAIAIDLLGVALENTQARKRADIAMVIAITVLPTMVTVTVVGTMVMVICMAVNVAATAVHPAEHIEIKLRE